MWHRVLRTAIYLGFLLGAFPETPLRAESEHNAWLRFARLDVPAAKMYETLPTTVVILGTLKEVQVAIPEIRNNHKIADDAFWLIKRQANGFPRVIITGSTDRGVLYGVFAFLCKIVRNESIAKLDELQEPYVPIRWVDQWDNLDGRIERGYAGRSIFFDNGAVRDDLTPINDYARLLASIG